MLVKRPHRQTRQVLFSAEEQPRGSDSLGLGGRDEPPRARKIITQGFNGIAVPPAAPPPAEAAGAAVPVPGLPGAAGRARAQAAASPGPTHEGDAPETRSLFSFLSCSACSCFSVGNWSFQGTTPALQPERHRDVFILCSMLPCFQRRPSAAERRRARGCATPVPPSPVWCRWVIKRRHSGPAHPARATSPASLLPGGRTGNLFLSERRGERRGIHILSQQRWFLRPDPSPRWAGTAQGLRMGSPSLVL